MFAGPQYECYCESSPDVDARVEVGEVSTNLMQYLLTVEELKQQNKEFNEIENIFAI